MPKIPGMPDDFELPPGIFAHGPEVSDEIMIAGEIAIGKIEDAKDMIPGGFGRFKREAKGGGRLPNRNG